MFIVEFPGEWFLRNQVATGDRGRATRFESEDAAREALAKTKGKMKAAAIKSARIVPVEG